MVVPTFSGTIAEGDDDLGASARSYLRQISAWVKMTRVTKDRQALVLYQHLQGRAWVEAEGLDIDKLATTAGLEYYLDWVKERYLDVQVTQVGRSLSEFFRKLKKKPGQSIRDFVGEYDRAHARLVECGCRLPDLAAAWVFVDRMGLEEAAELNLLASVGNVYDLKRLQQAAIVQDRALRKPWEAQRHGRVEDKGHRREWWGGKRQSALMAGIEEEDDGIDEDHHDEDAEDSPEAVPESVAEELYHAYMSHETAKQRYRDNLKLRGTTGDTSEKLKVIAADRLKAAKQKSFCAGCRRRGHWHKDPECPMNQGRRQQHGGGDGKDGGDLKTSFHTHVVHVTWDLDREKDDGMVELEAITDTACSRSVAGAGWLDLFIEHTARRGTEPVILPNDEQFRFGASRVFRSSYAAILTFALGEAVVEVKVAIVHGELPLLLSRAALAKLGMVMDVAKNRANFDTVGLRDVQLRSTKTGHPAILLVPAQVPNPTGTDPAVWGDTEVKIHLNAAAYMAPRGGDVQGELGKDSAGSFEVHMVSFDQGFGTDEASRDHLHEQQAQQPRGPQVPEPQHALPQRRDLRAPSELQGCPQRASEPQKKASTLFLFYPKKIDPTIKNMLLGDHLNVEAFMTWWKSTPISNDFWLEGENIIVRVHVIPRKTMFTPEGWETKNVDHKAKLLQSLGNIRSTTGISCKTHRDLNPVHGPWRGERQGETYPVLWVGRTLFIRRSFSGIVRPMGAAVPRVLPASHRSHRHGLRAHSTSEEHPPHAEERVDRRGPSPGDHSSDSMDRDRTTCHSAGGTGQSQGLHHGNDPEGTGIYDPRRADRHRHPHWHRAPGEEEPRHHHEDDQRLHAGPQPTGHELRQVQGADVQGCSTGIPALGSGRDGEVRQRLRGPTDVCDVGGKGRGDHADEHVPPGPRDGVGQPVRAGGNGVVGPPERASPEMPPKPRDQGGLHEADATFRQEHEPHDGEGNGERRHQPLWQPGTTLGGCSESQTFGDKDKGTIGSVVDQFHGAGSGGGDDGRDPPFGNEACCAERQGGCSSAKALNSMREGPGDSEGAADKGNHSPLPEIDMMPGTECEDRKIAIHEENGKGADDEMGANTEFEFETAYDDTEFDDAVKYVIGEAVQVPRGCEGMDGSLNGRDNRPLMVEVYAGVGRLGRTFERHGFRVIRVERPTWDLDQLDQRKALLALLHEQRPEVLWCAPDCWLWSAMQNLHGKDAEKKEELLRRREEHHKTHLSFVRQMYIEQEQRGGVGIIEHPYGSLAWSTPSFRDLPGTSCKIDHCAYGSVLPDKEGAMRPFKKSTRLQVTDKEIAEYIQKTCPGGHDHLHLFGGGKGCPSLTKAAGAYQQGFCDVIVGGIILYLQQQEASSEQPRQGARSENPGRGSKAEILRECEEFARKAVIEKDFTYATLQDLVELLPEDKSKRERKAVEKDREKDEMNKDGLAEKCLLGGYWTRGAMGGITNASSDLPWTCRYINMWGRSRMSGSWTSFYLALNKSHAVHTDHHNLRGTMNATTTFGNFAGGSLWVGDVEQHPDRQWRSDDDGVWRTDSSGKVLRGQCIDTKEILYALDPKRPHATQPWTGDRWVLTFYTTRNILKADWTLKERLRSLRFPLKGISAEADHRPKKSIRGQLGRMAKRLGALATWTVLAASTYLEPWQGPAENTVTLLEIGGMDKTFKAIDHGGITAEPIMYEDLLTNRDLGKESIEELHPHTLWIHGERALDTLVEVEEMASLQVSRGKRLVIEAEISHEIWTKSDMVRELLTGDEDIVYVKNEGGNRILEVNGSTREWDEAVTKGDEEAFRVYMVHGENRRETSGPAVRQGSQAISFPGENPVRPEIASALKRLHQNLGHPAESDLTRHLRLAGAGTEVINASKRLRCETCNRCNQGGIPRPASLPTALSFNMVVGVDAFTVVDSTGKKREMMSVYDHGTSYHLVGELKGHSTQAMEETFCEIWAKTFGGPTVLALDLETGLQAGLARFAMWNGTKLRSAAGQAHWQLGATERHNGLWKAIWNRVCDDMNITEVDTALGIAAVNAAKNELRRQDGFSPTQAVYGKDPYVPGDLIDGKDPEQQNHILTTDQQRAREHSIRIAARTAYFRCQGDQRLRRALLQRARVARGEVQVGDLIYFHRKPKNSKEWMWRGPATVIGNENGNVWASFAGRCHLIAPEHIRRATNEEIGTALSMRLTKNDLEKLLEYDPGDPEMYVNEEQHQDEERVGGEMEGEGEPMILQDSFEDSRDHPPPESSPSGQGLPRPAPDDRHDGNVRKKMKGKTPIVQSAHMVRRAKTPRGVEKQLEKELPWSMIPPSQHQAFRDAELKQWMEHVDHNAVQPVDVETSRKILAEKGDRVLPSRFAYRDKNWSKRRKLPDIEWRHKARLVIGGHLDPDLQKGLDTSAPTVSRQGVLLLLQILASRLGDGWGACAGDITAAFLNGEELRRELYIRQPRGGIGNLHPEQLIKLTKGVFGLVDSPHSWWKKLSKEMAEMDVDLPDGDKARLVQCELDPCIFQLCRITEGIPVGEPLAYLAVHVDDLLGIGHKETLGRLKTALSRTFPVDDWEDDLFEYIGSFVEVDREEGEVRVTQTNYTETRLFEVDILPGQLDGDAATQEQRADNRSLVGALSWLAGQTRADLQTGVSMCQQLQKDPTVGDIKFSNVLSRRARQHKEQGVRLRPVRLDDAVLLCYHDAGWANAPQDPEDPFYVLTPEEEEAGRIRDGPFAEKERKAKRGTSKIASQLGGMFFLANREILYGKTEKLSLLDWRSSACDRVCRSTFAAETMGCAGAVENGEYIQLFLETLLKGRLVRRGEPARLHLRYISDCRSLYDHLHKEGVPRVPSDRRLAIDVAAIRQDLRRQGRLAWVPTDRQFADIATKPLKPDVWWKDVTGAVKLPFIEARF